MGTYTQNEILKLSWRKDLCEDMAPSLLHSLHVIRVLWLGFLDLFLPKFVYHITFPCFLFTSL